MPNIFDIVNAPALASYWEELQSNTIPYLGESLFPSKRQVGLKLDWIKGYDKLPVALMPAAFDTKPTLRDRGGVDTVSTRMPFFREAMRIGEEDRQQLLTLMNAGNQYVNTIVDKLFDDASTLIDGAMVNPEIMRFELLQTGTITIGSPNSSGVVVNYNYNYDPDGKWAASNIVTKAGQEVWGGTSSNPIADILAIKRTAAAKGVMLTRAICSPITWAKLLVDAKIRTDVYPLNSDASLSDTELQQYLLRKTGINFTVYEKMYTDLSGADKAYMKDDRVVFLPSNAVGSTYFGTTPEEADLMSGNTDADVRIVGGGIAVLTKKESLPVNVITSVSEIVLPSFEKMDSVYVLKIA